MTTPDLLRKVAEAVRDEAYVTYVRYCDQLGGEDKDRLTLDAIVQRVVAEHAEVLEAPDCDGPWLARLAERAWDGKGDRWQPVRVVEREMRHERGDYPVLRVLVPGEEDEWLTDDFDRWQRIVPPC